MPVKAPVNTFLRGPRETSPVSHDAKLLRRDNEDLRSQNADLTRRLEVQRSDYERRLAAAGAFREVEVEALRKKLTDSKSATSQVRREVEELREDKALYQQLVPKMGQQGYTDLHRSTIQTALSTALHLHNIQEFKARNTMHIAATMLFAGLKCAMRVLPRLWQLLGLRFVRYVVVSRHIGFGGLVVLVVDFQHVPTTGRAVLIMESLRSRRVGGLHNLLNWIVESL
jgi:hypothetical protein